MRRTLSLALAGLASGCAGPAARPASPTPAAAIEAVEARLEGARELRIHYRARAEGASSGVAFDIIVDGMPAGEAELRP